MAFDRRLVWLSTDHRDSLDAFYIENQYSFLRTPTSFRSETISGCSYLRFCVGSVESWLIVAIRQGPTNRNFFMNPLSRARVMLPSVDKLFLKKIVASTAPESTTKMQQNNCFVAARCCGNCLGICRLTDPSWTLIPTRYDVIDIEIIDRKLYVVGNYNDYRYYVLEFDIVSEDDSVTGAKNNCGLIDIPIQINPNVRQYFCLAVDSASKELFIIIRRRPITEGVLVYKLEGRSSDGKESLEEVTDIGDRMLFLSSRSNKVINDKTLGKNCIYFALDYEDGVWVYSLTDLSFKRVNFPKDYSSRSKYTLWFTPHPW